MKKISALILIIIGLHLSHSYGEIKMVNSDNTEDIVVAVSDFDSGDESFDDDEEGEDDFSFDEDSEDEEFDEGDNSGFSESGKEDGGEKKEAKPSFLDELLKPARFTLKHEYSYKTEDPVKTVNNRSSFRLEYSKFFATYFFLQLDTKLNFYLEDDHISKADADEYYKTNVSTKDAYIQASFNNTSIKLGYQVLIWGEADGMAITDVISPRDESEFMFVSLEESRISQNILVFEQYSDSGTWEVFYIPEPEFNKIAEAGTEYYDDLSSYFSPLVSVEIESGERKKYKDEYGFRWRKTFGKSDISIMFADIYDNSFKMNGTFTPSTAYIFESGQRYKMYGLTFNYSKGNFLWKGEVAGKEGKTFTTDTYNLIDKNVIDGYLGLEYSKGSSYTIGLFLFNSHIADFAENIYGYRENEGNFSISFNKTYLNEDLSLTLQASTTGNDNDQLLSGQLLYQYNDNLKFETEIFYPIITNEDSNFWNFRDQKRLTLRVSYLF